ncbi:MAG TPA: hypothetical protein PLX35_11550 [Cyclobacteriaceae bacterium]|nr:hypothetical protein [Cyclobacteriaceae bacterium]
MTSLYQTSLNTICLTLPKPPFMPIRRFAILLALAVSVTGMQEIAAQTLTNVDFSTIADNKIEITYDLLDCPVGETYDIEVYLITKTDKATRSKLTNGLSGDLIGIAGGTRKVITYDVLTERDQLDGTVQFELRIGKTHRVKQQLWKADKGYMGMTLGIFSPNVSGPLSLGNGGFYQMVYGHTRKSILGFNGAFYFYNTNSNGNHWLCTGLSGGPMLAIPLGQKIKWDIRPQLGMSLSDVSDKTGTVYDLQYGFSFLLGTSLRFNIGERTSWLLSYDYITSNQKLAGFNLGSGSTVNGTARVGAHGFSLGVAIRLFR